MESTGIRSEVTEELRGAIEKERKTIYEKI